MVRFGCGMCPRRRRTEMQSLRTAPQPIYRLAMGTAQSVKPALRTWTSADGQFTVEGELITDSGAKITLKKKSGGEIEVPLVKLSRQDQEYVARRRKSHDDTSYAAAASASRSKSDAALRKTWTCKLVPYRGKLMADLTGVTVLFEGIPHSNGFSLTELVVAGPDGPLVEGNFGNGQQGIITHQTSYSNGVTKFVVGYSGHEDTLQFRNGGTELTVNGTRTFNLAGAKKTILIDSKGKASQSRKPIEPLATPMMGPMRPMIPPGHG